METNNERNRKVVKDARVTDTDQETPRNEANIEKNFSSNVTGSFVKKRGRTNHAFGESHEPGTLPGGGV